MSQQKKLRAALFGAASVAVVMFGSAAHANPTSVSANASSWTSLGTFAAGVYNIVATGTVTLGEAITVNASGQLQSNPGGSYSYMYPNGSPYDQPGNAYGPAGLAANLGSIMYSYASQIVFGSNVTITLANAGPILALVNDTYYPNNSGSFSVTVTPVPGPIAGAGLPLLVGLAGYVAWRRSRNRSVA